MNKIKKLNVKNPMFCAKKLCKKGFSLVEVMIVIAIIGISAGILFARVDSTNPSTEVELAGRQIAASLRTAQNNAISGKMQPDGGGIFSKTLREGVRLKKTGSDWHLIQYYAITAGSDIEASNKILKKIDIENVGTDPGCSDPTDIALIYYPVSGKAEGCGVGPSNTDNFKFLISSKTDNNIKFTVCAYKTGRVEEKEGAQSCP